MVKRKEERRSTAAGRQAARAAEKAAHLEKLKLKKIGELGGSAFQTAEAVFDKEFQTLGLGSVRDVSREIFERLSPESTGLTQAMVEEGVRNLGTNTTENTGERTTQLEALKIAKNEWGTDTEALRGDDFLTGYVKENIRTAHPDVKLSWFDELNLRLGSLDKVRGELYKDLQHRTSDLTEEMVGDGLAMLRTEENPQAPSWRKETQAEALKMMAGRRSHQLKPALTEFVMSNITAKHGTQWRRY